MPRYTTTTAWTSALVASAVLVLAGCASSQKELLPTKKGTTMRSIWHDMTGSPAGGRSDDPSGRLQTARQHLRRPLRARRSSRAATATPRTAAYRSKADTAATPRRRPSGDSNFRRVPNPTLDLYVYPHRDGQGEQVPVPGYTTVFPLYKRPHYVRRNGAETSPNRRPPTSRPIDSDTQRAQARTVDSRSGASAGGETP